MIFSSLLFLFMFLPVVIGLYYAVPNRAYRNAFLLFISLLFYAWGEPICVILMAVSIVMNYFAGRLIGRYQLRDSGSKAKKVLIAAIAINLLMLGAFKYTSMIVDTLKGIIPAIGDLETPIMKQLFYNGISNVIPALSNIKIEPDGMLPIGISFYTFQAMSYVIDVYRRDTRVQKNVMLFGTYVSLFPQLIAGPIVRYRDIADQLQGRRESVGEFASGVKLFTIGLAKKVLIANQMAALWDVLKHSSATNGALGSWVGIIAYTLQIYFDFGGYSDMAIGLGRMFGFEFLKNFDYPYISQSITEFWRRWHISLSTWFKEYVYIPLGGNRRGIARQLLNIAIVWALTGLWHGPSWNFVLWGLFYAALLMIEKLFLLKLLKKLPRVLRHIYTLALVVFGWVLFDFVDMSSMGAFISSMFDFGGVAISSEALRYTLSYLPLMLVGVVASTPLVSNLRKRLLGKKWVDWTDVAFVGIGLTLCVASLVSSGYNPFIYFRF